MSGYTVQEVRAEVNMKPTKVYSTAQVPPTVQQPIDCPFADVNWTLQAIIDSGTECPFHKIVHRSHEHNTVSKEHVHLKVNYFNYQRTVATARLLRDIGGGDRIRFVFIPLMVLPEF